MIHNYNFETFFARTSAAYLVGEFQNVLEYLPTVNKDGPWIAGGALRSLVANEDHVSDYDFFFKSEEQLKEARSMLEASAAIKILNKRSNDHCDTYSLVVPDKEYNKFEVQLVHISYYDSVEVLLESFDYTICQFAYDGSDLYTGEYSILDLMRRRLAVNKITYPVSSVRRMIKYTNKNFTACSGCITKVLEKVALEPTSLDTKIVYID